MPEENALHIYGNIVQVTRSPWEINLHVLRAIIPRTAKSGDTINILDLAEEVAVITLPLDIGKKLIGVLQTMTAEGVVEPVGEKAKEVIERSERDARDAR